MKEVFIDFSQIGDYEEFYEQLKKKLPLPDYFGDNLDGLYDVLTGDVEMPLHIEFVNLSVDQLETFEDLLETMEVFSLKPGKEIGILKEKVKEAILEGEIPNEKEAARNFVIEQASLIGVEIKK
ncbi:Ribonuclease inhibitor [Chlamydia trachomatis]|nr:Ribonuclease inhibitor [Chlamydia trachomatis]